jgi:hypothetical protein
MELDEQCKRETFDKFMATLAGILKLLDIDDDKIDVVESIRKVETKLNFLIEARNYLLF